VSSSITDGDVTMSLVDASAIARRVLRDSGHFLLLVVDEDPTYFAFCLGDPFTLRPLRGGVTVAVAPDGTYLRGYGTQRGAHEAMLYAFSTGTRELVGE
jgi:hypothetical protein